MRRARGLALVALALVAVGGVTRARGEEARPGQTLVLDHGQDAAVASAMPGGAAHDGRLAYPLPVTAPLARLVVATSGARPRGPAVDADGRIFVGTTSGVAILGAEGVLAREIVVGSLDCAPVLVPGGDVIALARDGTFARIASDGTVRARASTGLGVRFAPLVEADGGLAVVAASRTLAWLGSDLEVVATLELPDGLALSPTRTARGRWAIAAGNELVVVEPATRSIERTIALPGRSATPVAAASDGTLWVATVDGELVRVRGESRIAASMRLGARLPEATTSDRAMLALAPDDDVLVVVPARGLVRVAPDGTERWTWASETPLVGALSIDPRGRAAVIDRLGHLSVIDPSGASEWSMALEALPLGPAITTREGRVIVATERGVVLIGP